MAEIVVQQQSDLKPARPAEAHDRSGPTTSELSPHPVGRVGELHRAIGNQGVGRLLQRKLTINEPGDSYEQEADRVAEDVMQSDGQSETPLPIGRATVSPRPLQRSCACGGTCADCQEQQALQRKETSGIAVAGAGRAAPPIVHDVLRSPGRPLDAQTRSFMEPRFGRSFGDVRVHTDVRAAESARAVNARAYTVGNAIAFGAGAYTPETREGQQLLAHELAHVIQQGRGVSNKAAGSSDLEVDAESAARNIISTSGNIHVSGASEPGIAKQDERATFGNLPEEIPNPEATRIVLRQVDGVWREMRPNGQSYRATGTYAFVIQRGKIWAVKPSGVIGVGVGHTEAAAGGRVEYAGLVTFGSSKNQRGIVREWNNKSGHYLPVRGFKAVAVAAGLPDDERFKAFEGPREPGSPQAQLPVFQEKGDARLTTAAERKRVTAAASVEEPGLGKTPPVARGPAKAGSTSAPATTSVGRTGAPLPITGSQGQRVYGGAPSRPVEVPQSNRAAARGAAAMALMMVMDKLNDIGKEVQNNDARTKLLSVRQEIIDVLHREPGVGAVIELQFLEPEHRFQDIYWARTTAANAGKPTIVANPEARQPTSTFIYVEPVRSATPDAALIGPAMKEAKSGQDFVALYLQARGADLSGTGTIAIEMYDALQRGSRQFGFTDVRAGVETIRISDSARGAIEEAVASLAERSIRRRLAGLKGGIEKQQSRLSEKMKDWFGGAIKLTGHELDPARAHYAAAENYARDKKFGPASESINAGEAQVEEVWAALFEYDNGYRPVVGPI